MAWVGVTNLEDSLSRTTPIPQLEVANTQQCFLLTCIIPSQPEGATMTSMAETLSGMNAWLCKDKSRRLLYFFWMKVCLKLTIED